MTTVCGRSGLGRAMTIGVALAAAFWIAPSPVLAQSQCGNFYRIERGDTLRDITVRLLGHDRYRVLYQANRDILPSSERLETGQLIFVPCGNGGIQDRRTALAQAGRTPTSRDDLGDRAAVPDPPEDTVKVVTPYAPKFPGKSRVAPQVVVKQPTSPIATQRETSAPLRLVTASGINPIAEFSLPDGGLISVLIKEALKAGGHSGSHIVSFVEDRSAHLSVLMPTGAFDLTFPWPGPDCSAESLGPAGRALCQDFIVSRPIYEATVSTFVSRDSALASATTLDALRGRRVCRSSGFPAVDLESFQLSVKVVVKRTSDECVAAVLSGEVDAFSTPIASEPGAPLLSGLVPAPGLTWPVPVHALAWRQHPNAEQTIAILNDGLEMLQRSGRWFEIVSGYLHDVNEKIADIKAN